MDNPFHPRLLMPGAPDIPSHMRVSHDAGVYAEYADPSVTAIVYVPKWAQPIQKVFATLARLAISDNPEDHRKSNAAFTGTPGLPGENNRMLIFVMGQTMNWMQPAICNLPEAEQQELLTDVSNYQQDMLEAFGLLAAKGRPIIAERHYKPFGPSHGYTQFVFNPHRMKGRYAHKDYGPTAIFAPKNGTILVDQDGLDVEKLTLKLRDSQDRPARGIPQKQLAGRLWEVPDNSFLIMRGHEGDSLPQFHFFPYLAHNTMRHKLIAFAPPA